MSETFSDAFLSALGAWQRGWNEDQARREVLLSELAAHVVEIPEWFRQVNGNCYRKRYLLPGEFAQLFLHGGLHDGPTSWTTTREFAANFKGLMRPGAITAAIFEHAPDPNDVLLNIERLWGAKEFSDAVTSFEERGGSNADALRNFEGNQAEIILNCLLLPGEIVGLTGVSSGFDLLCDKLGIVEAARSGILKDLIATGVYPDEPDWAWDDAARRVIANTYSEFDARLKKYASGELPAPANPNPP